MSILIVLVRMHLQSSPVQFYYLFFGRTNTQSINCLNQGILRRDPGYLVIFKHDINFHISMWIDLNALIISRWFLSELKTHTFQLFLRHA